MNAAELLGVILACAPHVAPGTVHSIIDVESRGNVFAIGVNKGARLQRQPQTLAEAIRTARYLRERGYNFDAGLMQVNSANWDRLGLTPETVFDPCTNVRAGAAILTESYSRASRALGPGRSALLAALSAYNTGNLRAGFRNGYVAKVQVARARRAGAPVSPTAYAPSPRTPGRLPASGVAPERAWQAPSAWGENIAANTADAESTDTTKDAF